MNNKFEGLQIIGFYDNSQLLESGVEVGDWLVEYNGELIESKEQLTELKLRYQNTTNIIIKVNRNGIDEYFQIWPGELGVYLAEVEKNPDILKDAVRIDGIKRLEKRTGLENTFFSSLKNIFEYFQINIDYHLLITISAYPFRFQFKKGYPHNILDPTDGYDCASFLFDNLELKWEMHEGRTKGQDALIKQSIDKGIPVLARNLYDKEEWGIITGYQNKSKEFFCRSFSDKTLDYSLAPNAPSKIIIFQNKLSLQGESGTIQYLKDQIIEALHVAEELLNIEESEGYFIGNRALEEWQENLKDTKYFDKLNDEEYDRVCKFNHLLFDRYSYNCQIASDFFSEIIPEFEDSKEHLKRLSKFYKAESKVLGDCQKFIPKNSDENLRNYWNSKSRNSEVVALVKIQKKNREIMTIMEKLPMFKNSDIV
ncbi:MAG TPA: hypothetical protein ENG70_00735 [Candidatus Cloacimonetes bacterium]|nr:hypothetical protein [Candidatus Cloacimonadota bacterium]HEX37380.1 hypothetical protein [Candidatus Cloacimonadota bacterium]